MVLSEFQSCSEASGLFRVGQLQFKPQKKGNAGILAEESFEGKVVPVDQVPATPPFFFSALFHKEME